MSGLLVLIGLNGPRISRGASGFMSHVSSWLGAPRLKMSMTAFSSLPFVSAPAALNAASCDRLKPIAPSAPTCRKSRRVIPSHVVIEPLPVTLSMVGSFLSDARPFRNRMNKPSYQPSAPHRLAQEVGAREKDGCGSHKPYI